MIAPRGSRFVGVEARLVEALQPIRGFALASSLQHLFALGLYDLLNDRSSTGMTAAQISVERSWEPARVRQLLFFLTCEGVLERSGETYGLSPKAHAIAEFRSWYEMLIGGYGETFLQMGEKLSLGSSAASRNGLAVGRGSCGISFLHSIPMVEELLSVIEQPVKLILDLGCGSAAYLTTLCTKRPELRCVGVEPDSGAFAAAEQEVTNAGLSDRINLVQLGCLDFVESGNCTPDVTLLAFVIHEILGQEGRSGVERLLGSIFAAAPDSYLIVVDINYKSDETAPMRHALATAYYNSYFLLHPFTSQRLERDIYWEDLFDALGLEIVARASADPDMDSTGFPCGWLLRCRYAATRIGPGEVRAEDS